MRRGDGRAAHHPGAESSNAAYPRLAVKRKSWHLMTLEEENLARSIGLSVEALARRLSVSGALGAALLAAFVSVWAFYFAVSEAPSAISQSMAEAYAWGREFQPGYNQHPPFWAWICGAWFAVFPRAGWSYAILCALNAAIGLWGSWRLIGSFANGATRIAATALLLLTPFYTLIAYAFNANAIFLSIWPWTMYFFVRSIDKGKWIDALIFGVCMAAALLSKYYALILAATCLVAALQHPARRRYFASASPTISIAAAALLCAPHLAWLVANGAPPLRYLSEISHQGPAAAVKFALTTLAATLAENALPVVLVALAARADPMRACVSLRALWAEPRFRLLAILALLPLALSLAACLTMQSKLVAPMLMGTFSLVPLLAIEVANRRGVERLAGVATRLAVAICLAAPLAAPMVALGWLWLSGNDKVTEPRKELAAAATRLWREKTGLPLAIVGGSYAYGDAVAFYSSDRPQAFDSFDAGRRPWITPQDLAAHGLLSVCVAEDAGCLDATARLATPSASRTQMTLAHRFWGHEAEPVQFVVTVIPPF